MITSFFNTSKPVHFVLVALLMLIVFVFFRIEAFNEEFNLINTLSQVGVFLVVILTFSVFAFLVGKNNLTQKNSYKILLLLLLFATLPATLMNDNIILSNFFIVLALRRLVSLRTNIRIKKKLFDAAFWIVIASLFYFWAILFFALIILALVLFSISQFKNWIVPFVAILTVVVLYVSYHIIVFDSFGEINNYIAKISFDYTGYNSIKMIVGITVISSLGLWSSIFYINGLKEKARNQKPSSILILFTLLIAILIVVLTNGKSGAEFIFIFAPLAIILTNYIEALNEKWFAEAFIWLLVIAPFVSLLL
ncbi:DUF6427 family protein [Pontimicrobium sp. IMCC45349]|uniref:DUF6427 family protein n=1 Tax=Pontimicrobium sp. IMCC45349 TaxID=3391574 RepID=UPI0039A26CFF